MRSWIGVIVVLALVLIGSRRIAGLAERRNGLSMLIATGLPYVLIGAIAAHPRVGVLHDTLRENLRPLLEIALGALGMRIGAEFDVRSLERLPRGTGRLVVASSGGSILLAGAGTLAVLLLLERATLTTTLINDALILGACAAVSAPSGARAMEAAGLIDEARSRLIRRITMLGSAAGLFVLAVVTSLDLATHSRFHLPILAWLFMQLGLGAVVGLLALAVIRRSEGERDEGAVFLGSTAFIAGCAGYVGFSPLVIGCIAGAVVATARVGRGTGRFGDVIRKGERPMLLLCFVLAGALWQPLNARGWALVPVFLAARIAGKFIGAWMARMHLLPDLAETRVHQARVGMPSLLPISDLPAPSVVATALVPMSALSMAIIVSSAYGPQGTRAPTLATAVIGAGLLSELVFHAFARRLRA